MSYLVKLKKDKENQDKYDREVVDLKVCIKTINDNYGLYDGHFLEELKKFLEDYKPLKTN